MNKSKQPKKQETVEDLIEHVITQSIEHQYDAGLFHYIHDNIIDCGMLEHFETLPTLPKREALLALIKDSEAFKEHIDSEAEELVDGLIDGVRADQEYRDEIEQEEKEAAEEEARYAKERAQLAKQDAKKQKQKQLLAKTLNEKQKKALQDLGMEL